MKERIIKTTAILLVVLFVVTVTAGAVGANSSSHHGQIIIKTDFHQIKVPVLIPIHTPPPSPEINMLSILPKNTQ